MEERAEAELDAAAVDDLVALAQEKAKAQAKADAHAEGKCAPPLPCIARARERAHIPAPVDMLSGGLAAGTPS
jgi:hypothetical protein